MNFRLFEPGDFAQLYAIEEACFQPPLRFPLAYMRRLVNSASATTWVAESGGQLAGFAIIKWKQVETGVIAYIETIEVAEAHRKQGIGAELLQRVEGSARKEAADSVWLHVDAENSSAINLYESCGYTFQCREEGYYAGERPALIYSKILGANDDGAAAGD